MAVACIVPCCTDTELFACFMLSCVSCFGSSDRASQPFPFCVHTDGVLQPLSEWVVTNALSSETLYITMPPPRDDQYISISPTEPSEDDAGKELAAAAPGSATQEDCQKVGKGLIRLPTVTPRTSAPKSVGFQQFWMGYVLTFRVIPLVGGALIQVPGLLQGTLGPNSVLLHPWSMKLQVMLDTPTGRRSLNTYCVSVDTCWNLTLCMSWLTIVTWQSTNGKIPPAALACCCKMVA